MKQGRGIESVCVVEEGDWNDSKVGQALWYKWKKKKIWRGQVFLKYEWCLLYNYLD